MCALLVAVGASCAAAQDYGDRNVTDFLRDDAEITASVTGFAGGQWRTLSTEPGVSIPVSSFNSPVFVDIGRIDVETTGQTDDVEAAWWHQSLPTGEYIRFVMRTVHGLDFVPFGAQKDGSLIQAYSYELGPNGDGVDFRWWVTHVNWESLTISYSYDGGQTVFSDPTIHDPIGGADWDGTDRLHLGLSFPGDGVNWVQASYKIDVVPAPASGFALLGAGLLGCRRRR